MIQVSNAWQELSRETLLPEMFVEITYNVTEPGIHDEASVSATAAETYSDVGQLVERITKNSESYSTLDYGCWGLDGSFTYFDGTPVDPGYVYSGYSGADGTLTVQPEIVIDFESRHTALIPGINITWDKAFGGWATEFLITASNASGEVARKLVTGNTSVVTNIVVDLVNYSRIKITVLKWSHPFQRVRCTDIMLGSKMVYTKDDLLGFSHNQNVDMLSATLPENTITFKLRNDDGRWNPDSPTGMERYLSEQQEVRVRYGLDVNGEIEWINGGTYWLSEWNTPMNGMEVDFTAKNALEFMVATYTGITTGTLYDVATAAFKEANLPIMDDGSDRFIVDESLKDVPVDFSMGDSNYRISEVLQMVANAGNCVFYQDRDGIVRIEPRSSTYSGYLIDDNISYLHPEYTFNKPLKSVAVGYGTEQESVTVDYATSGEVQTVENPFVSTQEVAMRVGKATVDTLKNRRVVTGEFRADLRVDPLDNVMVTSKYASNIICITNISYETSGGAFRGKYTGRVVSVKLEPVNAYSNEFYSNEIW